MFDLAKIPEVYFIELYLYLYLYYICGYFWTEKVGYLPNAQTYSELWVLCRVFA